MKTINILGDSQREQWHSVVNMLRLLGGDLTRDGRSELCDELDRYIDAMEDENERQEQESVYVLLHKEYTAFDSGFTVDVKLFSDMEQAQAEIKAQYEETIRLWQFDADQQDEFHNCECSDDHARVNDYTDFADWRIEKMVVE